MRRTSLVIISLSMIVTSCQLEEKPLTKEEALAFAKKIEISIEKRESGMLDGAFDEKAFVKRMKLGRDSKPIVAGLKKSLKVGSQLCASLPEEGTYSFIKQYEKDKTHHILFRLYANHSLNYHDYELKRTNGEPKIVDIYIYLNGENLSETMKNLFGELMGEAAKNSTDEPKSWMKKLPDIRSLITSGKNREALSIYENIPPKIKKARPFQVVHVEICSGLSDEEYMSAIAEYEKIYPNEPNMQLLQIDGYIMRKDYHKALQAINELDKMIDKDPLLDYQRAMCYTLLEENTKRTECLEKLVKNMPYFEDGILELLADYLEADEFEKADLLVRRVKNKSAFNQSRLNTLLDQYPGYNEKYGLN